MTDPTPQRETILASLEQLLAWPEIARSQQLAKFLEYIVQRTLAGDEQSIKAYSIAVDVLGRSVDFDPQADPIVRVQARRLRGLLDQYYHGPGRVDAVQIALPVGRYVPEFRTVAASGQGDGVAPPIPVSGLAPIEASARRGVGGVRLSWFAVAVLAFGVGAIGLALVTFGPMSSRPVARSGGLQRPSVTVVEFQNLAGPGADAPMVAGLALELVTDLDQFEYVDARYGGGTDMAIETVDDDVSDYVLTGIVRRDRDLVQYSAILTDSNSGVVVWNHTIAVASADASQAGVLDEVSRRLSLILGSSRGPLHVRAREYLALTPAPAGADTLYLCRMLFDIYREIGTPAAAKRADQCVSGLPEVVRQSATGLAITASLLAEQPSDPAGETMSRDKRLQLAGASLDRAIGLSPVDAFLWEQHARLSQEMGDFDRAQAEYDSALQLNPANADALASYARLLAFGGNAAAAETMARDATDGTPNPPDWYFGVPALLALRSGSFDQAIEDSVRYAQADHELGPILAILAGQRGGDNTIVNRYLAQVLDVASFRTSGVLPRLRERVQDEALLEQIRGSLTAAGVPPPALNGAF